MSACSLWISIAYDKIHMIPIYMHGSAPESIMASYQWMSFWTLFKCLICPASWTYSERKREKYLSIQLLITCPGRSCWWSSSSLNCCPPCRYISWIPKPNKATKYEQFFNLGHLKYCKLSLTEETCSKMQQYHREELDYCIWTVLPHHIQWKNW